MRGCVYGAARVKAALGQDVTAVEPSGLKVGNPATGKKGATLRTGDKN